jgi:hypothetical protein
MVPVQRYAVLLVAESTTPAAAIVRAVVAATHALHIHGLLFILVRLCARPGRLKPAEPKAGPGKLPRLAAFRAMRLFHNL